MVNTRVVNRRIGVVIRCGGLHAKFSAGLAAPTAALRCGVTGHSCSCPGRVVAAFAGELWASARRVGSSFSQPSRLPILGTLSRGLVCTASGLETRRLRRRSLTTAPAFFMCNSRGN